MIRRVRSYLHTDSVEELESQTELILDTLHKQELQPSVVVVTSYFVSVGVFESKSQAVTSTKHEFEKRDGVGGGGGGTAYLGGSGGRGKGKPEQVDRRF